MAASGVSRFRHGLFYWIGALRPCGVGFSRPAEVRLKPDLQQTEGGL